MRYVKTILLVLLAVTFVSTAGMAWADEPSPEQFFGTYKGSGVTQTPNAGVLGFRDRDLDVEIGPDEGGFFIAWTTVFRDWGKEPKRKSARISFDPSPRPGIYLERSAAQRVGWGLRWASFGENTLTVRSLLIQDDGSYVVQTYNRMFSDDGMFLHFISDEDGQTIRMVTGRLTKE